VTEEGHVMEVRARDGCKATPKCLWGVMLALKSTWGVYEICINRKLT
jgi:hypothetical protein